jgi:formyl-CoA transferase
VDPHMAARGDLVSVDDPVIGAVRQQAPFPRLRRHPAPAPAGAPRLGQHNQEVWGGLLGLSDAEVEDLTARGVL